MTITEMICTGIALVWLAGLFSFLNWSRKQEIRTYQKAIEYWQQFAMENGMDVTQQLPQDCAERPDSHSKADSPGGVGG